VTVTETFSFSDEDRIGMKKRYYVLNILSAVLLVVVATIPAPAQDVSAAELRIERLRSQLREVVDREAQLHDRAARLDEDLKPENVERSVATVGTTDAAALRDKRREQLEKEKADVAGQLSEVAARRAGLEAEIAAAESEAVRLKAAALAPKEVPSRNTPTAATITPTPAPVVKKRAPAKKRTPRRRNRARRRM
jgi:hypothetical protein